MYFQNKLIGHLKKSNYLQIAFLLESVAKVLEKSSKLICIKDVSTVKKFC